MTARRSYSTVEVSRRLGVSIQTVQRWVDSGHLKAWKTLGGHRRISAESAETLLAEAGAQLQPIEATAVNPAAQVNAAVRAEVLELLRCTGRSRLIEAARTCPLVDVIGMLFCEISDLDSEAAAAPKLRERIAELEQSVADAHGPMQAQMAELNRRIAKLNEVNVALQEQLQHAVRFHDQLAPHDIERFRTVIAKASGGTPC